MLKKPDVFNYRRFVEALEEVERLKKQVTNLEIKCRILEENQPEWIPVSERLPEPSYKRLFVCGYNQMDPAGSAGTDVARWNGNEWDFGAGPMPGTIVTAWMPLPEPWKGDTK